MIKLKNVEKPQELLLNEVELTNEFLKSGKRVWDKKYIKDALLNMSNGKCCYCECLITEESKYMEVEHFLPKIIYPSLVVEWSNLLPSCKRCNVNKKDHDPKKVSIINPRIDNPKNYLSLQNYRLVPKNQKARDTINTLYLNESDRLGLARYKIGEITYSSLEDLYEQLVEHDKNIDTISTRLNKIMRRFKALLGTGSPEKAYASTVATVILINKHYQSIKEILHKLNLWDDECNLLELELQKIALL